MSVTEARLNRLEIDIGELLDRHETGLPADVRGSYVGRFPSYCSEVLGIELTPQQLEAAAAMDGGEPQVAIIGGNGLGKDTLTACRAIYEMDILDALVLLSAPTDRQVREILMRREIGRLWRNSRGKVRGERFEMAIRRADDSGAGLLAFTATDPDRFTGHHAPRIFIAMTESQGIPSEIWEACQACQVGQGLILAVGNPMAASGPLYAAANSKSWKVFHWSALDHPNVVSGTETVKGAVTRAWVEARRAEYGEESGFYVSRVLGQFPSDGSVDSLLTREQVEGAFVRWENEPNRLTSSPLVFFLDVARSLNRDESVAGVAQGERLHSLTAWRARDLVETSAKYLAIVDRARVERFFAARGAELKENETVSSPAALEAWLDGAQAPKGELWIDAPGVGSGAVDECRRRRRHVNEHWGWNPATDEKKFANLRAELFWTFRQLLESGKGSLPRDPKLEEEMLAMEYSLDAKGRILMIAKEDLRERLGRSPDRLDTGVGALARSCGRIRRRGFRYGTYHVGHGGLIFTLDPE
jgi:phage terminase large subunit